MNKVLIKLYVPMLGREFDIFIPVNEMIWRINKLIVKSVSDLSDGYLKTDSNYFLLNTETGYLYNNNEVVLNTDIRNGTKILLIENVSNI